MTANDAFATRTLYRSRHGWLLGVCQGIADYRDVPVFWVRMLVVVVFLLTGLLPTLLLYLAAAVLVKPEPVVPIETEDQEEFYNCYAQDRTLALHRLKRIFARLDQRIQRMESVVTSPEFDWNQRMQSCP
jgi:phage shock protein C